MRLLESMFENILGGLIDDMEKLGGPPKVHEV